jgi:tRNA dimethylallyltransferase
MQFRLHSKILIIVCMISAIHSFNFCRRYIKSSVRCRQRILPSTTVTTQLHMTSSIPDNLIVVISGPTGVGKSDVAARLCASRNGLIISADSVQVYRGVQIGANKPSDEERMETPHLLVDMVDASQQYNAAEWRRDALTCIRILLHGDSAKGSAFADQDNPSESRLRKEIADAKTIKGHKHDDPILPVVVGGTMMYLQWLVHGRPDAARPSEEAVIKARKKIDELQVQEDGWEQALRHVSSLNPIFENRIKNLCGQDWYRLRRTMEIAYTVMDQDEAPTLIDSLYSGEREGGLDSFGYDVRCFFLCPSDRMKHTSVVDERCEEMIIRGLLQETSDLVLSDQLPDMATKAIGYRQALDYLQRKDAKLNDEEALENFLNDFTTATRRYAKKQMQWFRKDEKFAFIPVSLDEPKSERVKKAAKMVEDMSSISREEYEEFLQPVSGSGNIPLSQQTKLNNEEQGKKMKFYQFRRYKLEKGSSDFQSILKHADACTQRLLESERHYTSSSQPKRQRLL